MVCYTQFINRKRKIGFGFITYPSCSPRKKKKALIWLSIVNGNENKVAHFTSSYRTFFYIEALTERIFNTYSLGEEFSILFSLNGKKMN